MQKNEIGPLSHTICKNKLKLDYKDLKVRPETINLLQKDRDHVLFDTVINSIFFGFPSSGKGNKRKNKQIGPHQIKKLLCSKGNHQQNEKATY